jgi:hypothetical protein
MLCSDLFHAAVLHGLGQMPQLLGGVAGGPAGLAEAAAAYDSLLQQVSASEVRLGIDAEPLADVEKIWQRADSGRRIVFVP